MAHISAKDIANQLGISTAAVSMALNGKPGVSVQTREKVIAAAMQQGYITPRAARNKQQLEPVISFVTYVGAGIAAHSSFSGQVLLGIEKEAKALGHRVVIHYLYENQPLDVQLATIANNTSGIVFLGTDVTAAQRDELIHMLQSTIDVPVVIVDNFLFSPHADCVGNDSAMGAKMAVDYLIGCGHRTIGYIRSKQRIANFDDRESGVHQALHEHRELGLAPLQVIDVDISSELAYQDICDWIANGNSPASAYFAENDMLAASAIRAFLQYGYAVPYDISIIGFDDVQICEMTRPSITTMHSFIENLGKVGVRQLHARILAGDTVSKAMQTGTQKIALSMTLKERESVRRMD
ncbi:LacI family DNA-binding transcriptional regulator [Eubacteriales bacterium OttesenSCG-928-N13]|nr:LacI family DNA-binding transcriptional regulator [Eubacteriales bacterium OttesenSCG-928-N13]